MMHVLILFVFYASDFSSIKYSAAALWMVHSMHNCLFKSKAATMTRLSVDSRRRYWGILTLLVDQAINRYLGLMTCQIICTIFMPLMFIGQMFGCAMCKLCRF